MGMNLMSGLGQKYCMVTELPSAWSIVMTSLLLVIVLTLYVSGLGLLWLRVMDWAINPIGHGRPVLRAVVGIFMSVLGALIWLVPIALMVNTLIMSCI